MYESQRGEEAGYRAHHLLPKFHGEGFAGSDLARCSKVTLAGGVVQPAASGTWSEICS